jgi:hypothetical protein
MQDLSNEVMMVRRITLEDYTAWQLSLMGLTFETAPRRVLDRMRPAEVALADLIADMLETDELWLAHSGKIGTLYGHEGVALVRDGKPIKYEIIIDH